MGLAGVLLLALLPLVTVPTVGIAVFATHAASINSEGCGDATGFQLFQFEVKWKSFPVNFALASDGGFGAALSEAFDDWDDITDQDFFEKVAPGSEDVDVLVSFASIDQEGGILAQTTVWYYRPPLKEIIRAEVVFDADDSWASLPLIPLACSVSGDDFDVNAVASHEFGHVVGIGHFENQFLTMNPYYIGAKGQTLATGDVDGFAKLYGSHDGDGGGGGGDGGGGKPPKCHPKKGC